MNFKKAFLYAGLDKQEINALMPEARRENGRYLRIYAISTAAVFIACLLVSFLAGGQLDVNKPIYIAMVVLNALIFINVKTTMKKRPELSTLLSVAYILGMYGYSFAVSLVHSGLPGTAAVAILVVMPCIFIYRPIYMVSTTVLAAVLYCLLSARIKAHDIAMLDVWNSVFFVVIAVLLSIYQMKVRFQQMLQKRENRILSETDLLTGVKNRNCFESNQGYYARLCKENVCCIYMDVNGLHELNDEKGHDAGDKMLKAAAHAMKDRFGQENVYRIGGDEFVAFCVDTTVEKIRSVIASMIDVIQAQGYNVSVGGSMEEKNKVEMKALVREAEIYMYREKRKYYEQYGHDRRHPGLTSPDGQQ